MALIKTKASSLFIRQNTTLPTPPTNFVETNSPLVVVPNFAKVSTNRMNGAMNSKDEAVDTCKTSTAFLASVDMRETGAVLTKAPTYAELLKISGFDGSVGADTYTLSNSASNITRGSAVVFMDGNKFTMTDSLVGDTTIELEIGQIGKVSTTLSGFLDSATPTVEANPTVTLDTENVQIVSCLDVVGVGGVSYPAEKIVFKTNPDIANTYTMGGADGLKQDTITDYSITCEITFPVDSAVFGSPASLIEAGTIMGLRCVIGATTGGVPVNGKSVVFLADTTKATTYADSVNDDLLQRVLTLRLYDDGATKALRIITGNVSAL